MSSVNSPAREVAAPWPASATPGAGAVDAQVCGNEGRRSASRRPRRRIAAALQAWAVASVMSEPLVWSVLTRE